ncbi:endoplasmic reticulum metallopeptidase 1-like [Plutella xylostella]|uniref:endoplasmic reticulum metallopeptidase 1-like n=1 Tax=Plutella xylostella TaxID=51655 RepID=UPI002032A830|nr:endoplasmic reticulum metallopeptidase 1-like [Plutella xylostella]
MDIPLRNRNRNERIYANTNIPPVYIGVPTAEPRGKSRPWKRAVHEISRKGTHLYEPVKSVPSAFLVLLLAGYLLLGYLAQLIEDDLAHPVADADIAHGDPTSFSEESAQRYLNQLVGDQPRVAGTPYHLQKSSELKGILDGIAEQAAVPVRTDWQIQGGAFLRTGSTPHITAYADASNLVAMIEGEPTQPAGRADRSILVNCHYDSVPFALGASDNAAFCAVMLETMNRMSRRKQRYKNNVIFLFNGAEEVGLQGSYAFVNHTWFKEVKAVINLDSVGINGKPNLFQATNSKLLDSYRRRVRRPNAHALGELLFHSGLVPSDTDFRVWSSFGGLQGIDIAFFKSGHVYHTRLDRPPSLRGGVLQTAGDAVLGLLADAADDEGIGEQSEATTSVYFDYLNIYLFVYSERASYYVDVVVAVAAVVSVVYYMWLVGFHRANMLDLALCTVGRIAAMAGGVLLLAVLVPFMIATTVQMRYLTQPWIVVPIFWVPFFVGAITASQLFDAWTSKKTGLNRSIRTIQAMAATRLILAFILLVLLCVPGTHQLRYILSVPLLFMSVCACVSMTVLRMWRLEGWHHLLLEVALSVPSILWLFAVSIRVNALILPVMGRTVTDYPDLLVAAVNVALIVLACVPVSGTELLFSRRFAWAPLAAALCASLALMLVPFSVYSDDVVQRHYWFHTEIKSYNYQGVITDRTSGVLITRHDAYTIEHARRALQGSGYAMSEIRGCEVEVYCNLPLYRPRYGDTLKDSLFLSMDPPAAFDFEPSFRLTQKHCFGETCWFTFDFIGGPHNTITVHPAAHTNITRWVYPSPLAHFSATTHHNGRPVYTIVHSTSLYSREVTWYRFQVYATVPLSQQSMPMLHISFHAHNMQSPETFTPQYRNLVNSMPSYFNIASTMSFRYNYQF